MPSKKSRVVLLTTIFALSLTGPLLAQDAVDPAQLALDYSGAIQANTKALTAYSWNQRSDVSLEGAEVVVILELIRYTDAGERQVTLISQDPGEPGGRGPKHKKAKKIYEASVGAAQSIPQLLMGYTMLSSGQLVDFFGNGTMSPGEDEMAGTTKIVGANVMQKGDAVTLWIDVATLLPKAMDVKTVANDKPIEAYLDFSVLEDGTSYLSHAETLIPENDMKIVFETFDHKK
jgi:hypothetical protein